jgi:polyhydroxybutyrate depolymerase
MFMQNILKLGSSKLKAALLGALLFCTSLLLLDRGAGAEVHSNGQLSKQQFPHQGLLRQLYLYQPRGYATTHPVPLVLIFHGYRSSGLDMIKLTAFNQLADQKGFLAVYPEAITDRWHTNSSPQDKTQVDVSFVHALIEQLKQTYSIDPKRIYAVGMSNGGFFTQRLACELPDQITAFASVAATIGVQEKESCHPTQIAPILMINGSQDPVVTWQGQIHRVRHAFRDSTITSVPQAIDFWRQQHHCDPTPQSQLLPNLYTTDHTRVKRVRYANCVPQGSVEQLIILGGGHTWPGSNQNTLLSHLLLGRNNQDISATQEIWRFFENTH